jgi:hypothetical protein
VKLTSPKEPIGLTLMSKITAYSSNASLSEIQLGGQGGGETPDPISNSEVKSPIADGTLHESRGE